MSGDGRQCQCGNPAKYAQAGETSKNPGKWYYACVGGKPPNGCGYFEFEGGNPQRGGYQKRSFPPKKQFSAPIANAPPVPQRKADTDSDRNREMALLYVKEKCDKLEQDVQNFDSFYTEVMLMRETLNDIKSLLVKRKATEDSWQEPRFDRNTGKPTNKLGTIIELPKGRTFKIPKLEENKEEQQPDDLGEEDHFVNP